MHAMVGSLEVKGDATEASVSDNDTPAWAAFRAPQSLAPSPHIARNETVYAKINGHHFTYVHLKSIKCKNTK